MYVVDQCFGRLLWKGEGRKEQEKRGRVNRIRIGRAGLDCSQDFSAPSAVQQSAWIKWRNGELTNWPVLRLDQPLWTWINRSIGQWVHMIA